MRVRCVALQSRGPWRAASAVHRHRHREPWPPPPLRGIVLDGSNVVANASVRAAERLRLATAWFRDWRPDLPQHVFFDQATFARCAPSMQRQLLAEFDQPARRLGWTLGPPGESADPLLLRHAAEHGALLVTNDRFWDHEQLRRGVLTLQFVLAGTGFRPYAEATWFLPSGAARRVGLQQLA
jgi:hypothetical protein